MKIYKFSMLCFPFKILFDFTHASAVCLYVADNLSALQQDNPGADFCHMIDVVARNQNGAAILPVFGFQQVSQYNL
jgi:hypothetical protein